MVSRFTHAVCERCWIARNTNADDSIRVPTRLTEPEARICCYCAHVTIIGVFVRDNPANTMCGGIHA